MEEGLLPTLLQYMCLYQGRERAISTGGTLLCPSTQETSSLGRLSVCTTTCVALTVLLICSLTGLSLDLSVLLS